MFKRPVQAFLANITPAANLFCLFSLEHCRPGISDWKKELRIFAPTCPFRLPVYTFHISIVSTEVRKCKRKRLLNVTTDSNATDGALAKLASFALGETAPDAVALIITECFLEAVIAYITGQTYPFCFAGTTTFFGVKCLRIGLRAERPTAKILVLALSVQYE